MKRTSTSSYKDCVQIWKLCSRPCLTKILGVYWRPYAVINLYPSKLRCVSLQIELYDFTIPSYLSLGAGRVTLSPEAVVFSASIFYHGNASQWETAGKVHWNLADWTHEDHDSPNRTGDKNASYLDPKLRISSNDTADAEGERGTRTSPVSRLSFFRTNMEVSRRWNWTQARLMSFAGRARVGTLKFT